MADGGVLESSFWDDYSIQAGAQAGSARMSPSFNDLLQDACTDCVAAGLNPNATALKQVGHRCEGLAAIAAGVADGENEVAEGEVAFRALKGLFHVCNWVKDLFFGRFYVTRLGRGCSVRYL